ncbi:MAG: MFS transporter [Phycisphaeraceae bacterium]|nr:MAG: MFS transporter [Phycisphaeraceae bacterium]
MPLLADIPNRRQVWAWALYDLANQSFQLLINTLLFGLFLREVVVGGDDPRAGTRIWTMITAGSLLIIVILSPFLGALADQRQWKRELLLVSGVLCGVLTCALASLGRGDLALAATLYIIAAVACGLGENFLGSFLPQLSTPATVGRVSAFGWTMSYIGALVLLGIVAAWIMLAGRAEMSQARPLFLFAGIWFIVGIVPSFIWLREKPVDASLPESPASLVGSTASRLVRTVREAHRFRQLARFLAIFFVYSMGTQSVIYFLGMLGDDMGFKLPQLILFALVMSIAAGFAAFTTSRFQDRLGHTRTISIFLGVWVAGVGVLIAAQLTSLPPVLFWCVSALLGIGLGGIGTSSRAIVGAFTPLDRAAEFFGLWGMVYKLSGICGVLLFGTLSTLLRNAEGAPLLAESRALALGALAVCFSAGLVLLRLVVDEREGVAAASRERTGP